MADHWKSIADLLGAPTFDEPEETSTPAEERAAQAAESPTAEPKLPEPKVVSEERVVANKNEASTSDKANSEALDRHAPEDPDFVGFAPSPKTTSFFDDPSVAEPPKASAANSSAPSSNTVASKPVPQSPNPKTTTPVEQPKAAKKKKSSWETLASMFNISIDRDEEPKPVMEPTPEPEKAASELAIFEEPQQDSNPALRAMFGETNALPSDEWHKPRRMVDDLGWDDDAPEAKIDDELPAKPFGAETIDESGESDAAPRRRRRRRGGRGRNRDETRDGERPTVAKASDDEEPIGWGEPVAAKASGWTEREALDREALDTEPEALDSEDDEEDIVVERRSNRRRRRGRGRDRDVPTGRSQTEPAGTDRSSFDLEPELDVDARREPEDFTPSARPPRGKPRDGSGDTRGSSRGSHEARGLDDERDAPARRRRRRRPTSSDAMPKPAEDDEVSPEFLDAEDDGDETSAQKHRNIPTWQDSLETLIQANIENHRRNEGRGGGPRGRPRGRR